MATKAERLILIEAKAGLVASEQLQGRQRILGLEGQDPRVQLIELPSPA